MLLILEIAAGVVLGLVIFRYLKAKWDEEEFIGNWLVNAGYTMDCYVCGHPRAYHKQNEDSGKQECTNCAWYETDGKKHGWNESRPYSADNGYMKAGDYSAFHNFQPEKKKTK